MYARTYVHCSTYKKNQQAMYVCLYLDSHKCRSASVCTYVHRLTVGTNIAQYGYTQSMHLSNTVAADTYYCGSVGGSGAL